MVAFGLYFKVSDFLNFRCYNSCFVVFIVALNCSWLLLFNEDSSFQQLQRLFSHKTERCFLLAKTKIFLVLNNNHLEKFGHDFRLSVQAYVRILLVEEHRSYIALRILFEIRILTVCYYHVTYEFPSKSTLYSLPE